MLFSALDLLFSVAIELIVQHIRDFLNDRGRHLGAEHFPTADDVFEEEAASTSVEVRNGKKKAENLSHNMHRPH